MNADMRQRLAGAAGDLQMRALLAFDGTRDTLAADARVVLDRDPVILMDEVLRE